MKYDVNGGSLYFVTHTSADKTSFTKTNLTAKVMSVEKIDISMLGDNYKWV
jgi:hypothetical protein